MTEFAKPSLALNSGSQVEKASTANGGLATPSTLSSRFMAPFEAQEICAAIIVLTNDSEATGLRRLAIESVRDSHLSEVFLREARRLLEPLLLESEGPSAKIHWELCREIDSYYERSRERDLRLPVRMFSAALEGIAPQIPDEMKGSFERTLILPREILRFGGGVGAEEIDTLLLNGRTALWLSYHGSNIPGPLHDELSLIERLLQECARPENTNLEQVILARAIRMVERFASSHRAM